MVYSDTIICSADLLCDTVDAALTSNRNRQKCSNVFGTSWRAWHLGVRLMLGRCTRLI